MRKIAAIFICMLMLTGCVSTQEFDSVSAELAEKEQVILNLEGQVSAKEAEIAEKSAYIATIETELDELKNGAQMRLTEIRNLYESEKWEEVIKLSGELHAAFNGSGEDKEAEILSAQSQEKLDEIARLKQEEDALKAAEAAKSAEEKARSIIRVTKIKTGSPNSAGGVDLFIGYKNMSDKVIKYATFTIVPYNKVGDVAYCDIRGYSTFNARDEGPYAKNEGLAGNYNWYWECAWYNWSIQTAKLERVYIEYMDGSTASVEGDDIGYIQY